MIYANLSITIFLLDNYYLRDKNQWASYHGFAFVLFHYESPWTNA